MNQQERDKYLTEEVLGECWHETILIEGAISDIEVCRHCGSWASVNLNNFFTPEGFFKLWNAAKEKDWWESFLDQLPYMGFYLEDIVNPDRFANAVYEFLKER